MYDFYMDLITTHTINVNPGNCKSIWSRWTRGVTLIEHTFLQRNM